MLLLSPLPLRSADWYAAIAGETMRATVDPAPGLSLLPDGFRRVSLPPTAGEATAVRALLSRAVSGQGRIAQAVKEGLATLRSWENATIIATLLPPGALGRSPAARRALQRVLRILASKPASALALASADRGTAARLVGRVTGARSRVFSHIWEKSERNDHNVRLLVEEGHDFFLTDAAGPEVSPAVLIVAAGGCLIGGTSASIDVGDRVEVFGFVDRLVDPASPLGSSKPRGEPLVLALRAGDELPLVVRKTAAAGDGADPARGHERA